ncbi:MAG: hypothetical protein QGH45_21210, partial [Myxococcota bacterium]|nr:hypothetical protein [Myxococcota bacterium]
MPTAALLIAQRPAASRILVVGQGAEGRIAELLAYRPDRLVHLQPDRAAAEALERHLPPALTGVLTDPALDRRFGDPRRELTRIAAGGGRFDLIVLDLGDPTTAAANRLATREFVDLCGDLLADDGALATRIGATVNYQGEEVRRYAASALLTLGQVFDEVAVIPGETSWLIAGAAGIPSADPDELARRYRSLAGPLQAVPAGTFASLVEPRRVAAATASYASAAEEWGEDLLNTDAAPVAYLLQLRVLAHASGSALPAALGAAQRGGAWLVIVPLLVACGVSLRRSLLWPDPEAERRRAGALLVGLAGAAAIALQVCLILSFQVRFGDLFAQVGWLNALFMAGLAAGGLAGGRWLRGSGLTPPIVFCLAGVGLCLMAGSAIPALQTSIAGSAGPLYYALIATGGAVFGAGFPVAGGLVTHRGSSAGAVGATLEAADHWGAALGAALVGVALVPLLGPARTSTLLALALAIAAVTIALPPLLR